MLAQTDRPSLPWRSTLQRVSEWRDRILKHPVRCSVSHFPSPRCSDVGHHLVWGDTHQDQKPEPTRAKEVRVRFNRWVENLLLCNAAGRNAKKLLPGRVPLQSDRNRPLRLNKLLAGQWLSRRCRHWKCMRTELAKLQFCRILWLRTFDESVMSSSRVIS